MKNTISKNIGLRNLWRRWESTTPKYSSLKSKFDFIKTDATIRSILDNNQEQKVCLNGWIDNKPKKISKKLIFGSFRDTNGDKIQIIDSSGFLLQSSNIEDCVQIQGVLKVKRSRDSSSSKATYEVDLESMKTLNQSNKKPSQLRELLVNTPTDKDPKASAFPQEYRYLQLRSSKYQNLLKKRYLANKTIRGILDAHDFTEVETPLLFKSTPEGAREFLVPTRSTSETTAKPLFYALPQSPQQYKQLLMASGVYRYFQIAKCFRDEDLRSDRQPEFTQIDMELSFATEKEVMDIVTEVVSDTWHKVSGDRLKTIDPKTHAIVADVNDISKVTYRDVMTKYGIDKPNFKFPDLSLINLKEFGVSSFGNKDFPVFEVLVLRDVFKTEKELKFLMQLLKNPHNYKNRVPTVIAVNSEHDATNWFEQVPLASFENPLLVNKFLKLKKGDIIIGCDRERDELIFENPTPLGRARQLIINSEYEGFSKFLASETPVAAWVTDFPMFTPVEAVPAQINEISSGKQLYPEYEPGTYTSTHHPFTMCKPAQLEKLLESDATGDHKVLKIQSLHYDLVVDGVELGGGSVRIHDFHLQEYIFSKILKVENKETFKHLLNAFQMGCPPHAGFAIGFDRMCAMMLGMDSIRDVIAFPKTVTGGDPVVGSPTPCTKKQLQEYHL